MSDIFVVERQTFNTQLPHLIETQLDRYVAIKGEEIVAVCDTQLDAIQQGRIKCGDVNIFVKKVSPIEESINLASSAWRV